MEKKELKDLDLLDRFLFAEAIEDPETMELILEIILGREVILKHLPQAEKEQRSFLWSKQVKLDVWAKDIDDVIYDTEVQKRNTKDLPKRSRLYNSLIDSNLLPPGTTSYKPLNDVYVIMIMPFDLFGKGLYSTDETAERAGSERIARLHEKISDIKASEEIGVKFMNAWEEKLLDRQDGYDEGKREGLAEGEKKGRQAGLKEGERKGLRVGEKKGRKIGRQEGQIERSKEIAARMKARGISPEEIAELTGLEVSEVDML